MPDGDPARRDVAPTRLLDGRLLLWQPPDGHRAGTDAVLLASAVTPEPGCVFVDVGAGVGTVGLALALREPSATGHLVEQDGGVASLARENTLLNGVGDRVYVHAIDVFDRDAGAALAGKADLVVSNPPFHLPGRTRASVDPAKARAHVLPAWENSGAPADHAAWLRAALSFLAPRGRLVMIHRPEALPALLAASEGRLGGVIVRPVQAHVDKPAIRILFGGIVGSRAPFGLTAPLVLHRPDGSFTPEAEGLHRGVPLNLWPQEAKKKPAP